MRRLLILAVLAGIAFAGIAIADDSQPEPKLQTICPVAGGDISKAFYADHNGKRIYFCCPVCEEKFAESPDEYVKKLEDQDIQLPDAPKPQTNCPIMGGKIDESISAEHQGKRVYFCCPMCLNTFKDDPEKYVQKLEAQGIELEKVVKEQTVCPVMGGKIDRELFADYNGRRVYFCCGGCKTKFEKAPEQYIEKLEDEGVTLEAVRNCPTDQCNHCTAEKQIQKHKDNGCCR